MADGSQAEPQPARRDEGGILHGGIPLKTLFLSDIHLNPAEPERHTRFIEFLRRASGVDHVYLLGDVFDYWIGPNHLDSGDYRVALDGFRELTRRGLPIDFIPGNRDYLVEERFSRETGIGLIGEECEIDLGGRRVYLAHGDFLYNRNPKYSAYRRMMRFGGVRSFFLNMPPALVKGLALGFRKVSVKTTPYTVWTEKDLIDGAERVFRRGVDVVICGHIHQPTHLKSDGRDLFVMGEWGAGGEYVEFDGSTFVLKKAPA